MNIFEKLGLVTKKTFDAEMQRISDCSKVNADIADITIIEDDIKTLKETVRADRANLNRDVEALNEKLKVNKFDLKKFEANVNAYVKNVSRYFEDIANGNDIGCINCGQSTPYSLAENTAWIGLYVNKVAKTLGRTHFINSNQKICGKCAKLSDIELYKNLIEENNEKSN